MKQDTKANKPNKPNKPTIPKLSNAQQRVIDSLKASEQRFSGKTYEEAYPRIEDRYHWTEYIYAMSRQGFYIIYAKRQTINSLVKMGLVEITGVYSNGSQFVKLL